MHRTGPAVSLGLALLYASAVSAADGRRWLADGDSEFARLIYGTPESDDMVLSLSCEKDTKTFWVWFAPQPIPVKASENMPLTIASDAGELELTAQGNHSDMDDSYSLEAKTTLTPAFAKLLSQAKTISIKVENHKMDLPLDDIALKGADELVQACRKTD